MDLQIFPVSVNGFKSRIYPTKLTWNLGKYRRESWFSTKEGLIRPRNATVVQFLSCGHITKNWSLDHESLLTKGGRCPNLTFPGLSSLTLHLRYPH